MELRLFDNENNEIRKIDLGSKTFLVVMNGESGPLYDRENLRYLKLDDKHVIRQGYVDIVRKLQDAYYNHLYGLWPDNIAFVVDEAWEPSEKANKNSAWKIDIAMAPYYLSALGCFDYVIKMRQHWLEKWTDAQLHAAIMSQLLRINADKGYIYKYTEDFHSKLLATFGRGYLEPGTVIPDLLQEDVVLVGFREASGQVTIDEELARVNTASKDKEDDGDDDVA